LTSSLATVAFMTHKRGSQWPVLSQKAAISPPGSTAGAFQGLADRSHHGLDPGAGMLFLVTRPQARDQAVGLPAQSGGFAGLIDQQGPGGLGAAVYTQKIRCHGLSTPR